MQKLKNNEARPKFTGSYKKKRVWQAVSRDQPRHFRCMPYPVPQTLYT